MLFAGSDLIFFEAEMIELLKLYQKVVPADLLQEKFDFAAKTKWTKRPSGFRRIDSAKFNCF